jgi:uncharacterized OB-fold protein
MDAEEKPEPELKEKPDFADPEGRGKICFHCGEHMSYDQHLCPKCGRTTL